MEPPCLPNERFCDARIHIISVSAPGKNNKRAAMPLICGMRLLLWQYDAENPLEYCHACDRLTIDGSLEEVAERAKPRGTWSLVRSCGTLRRRQDQFGEGLDGARTAHPVFGVLHHAQAAPKRNSRSRLPFCQRGAL